MHLLIVDDDEFSLMLLADVLRGQGHKVETATSAARAMKIILKAECHMVISDWEMPQMSGLDLCRAIRNADTLGYVYIVLLTARNSTAERVEGLHAGADDFMSKPFDPAELNARIQTAERILALETRDITIFAMARLAESRDPDTGAHLERVRAYARLLSQDLLCHEVFKGEMDAAFVRLIYLTTPLHDIGKVGIPDRVLLKPGQLTQEEFEIMKTHTTLGAETLAAALKRFPGVKFLEMGRDVAATHHERFDGKGYPHKLKGRDIPLCGRITSLADVYDALTTKRVYKEAFTHEKAMQIITEGAGTQFDPEIVKSFLRNELLFTAVKDEYSETNYKAA